MFPTAYRIRPTFGVEDRATWDWDMIVRGRKEESVAEVSHAMVLNVPHAECVVD